MKRAAISALILAGVFSLGIVAGRISDTILPSRTQLLDELIQAQKSQEEIASLRREVSHEAFRRISQDPLHRFGGQAIREAEKQH